MNVLSTGRPLISNEIVQVQSWLKRYALNNFFMRWLFQEVKDFSFI
jgi:hypothetical protein